MEDFKELSQKFLIKMFKWIHYYVKNTSKFGNFDW